MPFKDAGKNVMLDALCKGTAPALHITHVSAHSAFPATDANELSGGVYARQAIAYNTAAAGSSDDSTNGATIPIPGGSTVAALGFYSASTAGTLLADADVTDEVFAADGQYVVDDSDHSIT